MPIKLRRYNTPDYLDPIVNSGGSHSLSLCTFAYVRHLQKSSYVGHRRLGCCNRISAQSKLSVPQCSGSLPSQRPQKVSNAVGESPIRVSIFLAGAHLYWYFRVDRLSLESLGLKNVAEFSQATEASYSPTLDSRKKR